MILIACASGSKSACSSILKTLGMMDKEDMVDVVDTAGMVDVLDAASIADVVDSVYMADVVGLEDAGDVFGCAGHGQWDLRIWKRKKLYRSHIESNNINFF